MRWIFPKLERFAPFLAQRYFIKIFFTPLKYPVPEKEKQIVALAETFSFAVNKKRIQGYQWGSGPRVLLVHGWAGRCSQFRKFIEVLVAEGFQVVGFDGPAHGKSEGKSTDIVEFELALRRIFDLKGVPEAIIAHSFGGGAVLYAAMNGLPVKKLINIASPTIDNEIIGTYLRTINGSWKTGDFFKKYILKKTGKTFHEFTAMHFIKNLPERISLLLVHDEDDREAGINQPFALKEAYPHTEMFITKGLGHTRILKDEDVIMRCVTFIKQIRL